MKKTDRLGPERFVLDAYAILAFLMGERGGERVRDILNRANGGNCQIYASIINVGEVLYVTERREGSAKAQDVLARIAASHIKAHWRLAYADCFAAALARTKGATVVTGDPEFKQLEMASVVPVIRIAAK